MASGEENGDKMMGDSWRNEVFISVKEEPFMFVYGNENLKGDFNGEGGDAWAERLPKPVLGLREIGAPPFLNKTFDMVDDPETDSIISWSPKRTSFVVWDHHKFSTDLLPKHFKHSNFSSFVRQLNTYRFRKIDSDRWEFANEGFQQGKKHLLKHIKRRKPNSQIIQQQGTSQSWVNSNNHGVEAEFEKLKTDQNTLKTEILKLRQQQENTQRYLATVKDRLHITEMKQKHMGLFLIKFLKNPLFLQRLTEKMEKISSLGISQKRKAIDNDEIANMNVDSDKNIQVQEIQSEIQTLFSSDESGSPAQEKKTENSSEKTNNSFDDACSENFVLWEKLMEDDMIYEDDCEVSESKQQQSDIIMELEDLILNRSDCSIQMRGLVELVGCLASIT
ncbi:hypothetical protein DH2020_045885 [Rehmannia glutinosa]|uniref:HSF-type DNA-binding domain-containing protein n=1 Tax=Rehmannia glutinosa TaxID=99300 RepID=A0ABR0UDX3_REHGL